MNFEPKQFGIVLKNAPTPKSQTKNLTIGGRYFYVQIFF